MSDERHEYEPVSQWYGSAWWVKLSDYNNLARQLRERDERIKELEKLLAVQIEVRKMSDALADEHLAARESAERKLAEAEEAIKKTPKLIGMDWKMKPEWLNLPAVRRALDPK